MPKFMVGDRVFVFKPAARSGKSYKFARPYHGPYRIVKLYDGGADVTVVDRPKDPSIRVPFERLRVCPNEVPDVSWPPKVTAKATTSNVTANTRPAKTTTSAKPPTTPVSPAPRDSVWAGRLRNS